MFGYIIKDLTAVIRFLPYGVAAGILAYAVLYYMNKKRCANKKQPLPVVALTCVFFYLVVMLCITFWSRESGVSTGIDLRLGSTWAINNRNKAFVIENVLLFIPYGMVCPWAFVSKRNWFSSLLLGLVTSTAIECLQFITGKGFFQLDDILTNGLGMLVGYWVYAVGSIAFRKNGKAMPSDTHA